MSIDRAHMTCRAPFNHNWDTDEAYPVEGGFFLRMTCSKCGTTFRQIIRGNGELSGGRKYKYPDDYRDDQHWTRADWRLNYLSKLTAKKRARR